MFCLHGKWSNPSLPLLQQDREKHELEIMAWTKEWERCWRKWWKISGTRKCQLEGWAHLRVEWPPLHRTTLALHQYSNLFLAATRLQPNCISHLVTLPPQWPFPPSLPLASQFYEIKKSVAYRWVTDERPFQLVINIFLVGTQQPASC